jgi:16S rRNA (uracil1498-N3)-methyltransferase
MPRIFLPGSKIQTGFITIEDEKARYLSVVLRCRPGDSVDLTDEAGDTYLARIKERTSQGLTLEVLEKKVVESESPLDIHLVQGLLKGARMDMVVQKATELGVKRIQPAVTERSQVRETRKLPRWKKIAEEAARQSGRTSVPAVMEPAAFAEIIGSVPPRGGILFWEGGGEALREAIGRLKGGNTVTLLTGPEGGFSVKEVGAASGLGFSVATLGSRILRAETAAITAVSLVQYELGDLG